MKIVGPAEANEKKLIKNFRKFRHVNSETFRQQVERFRSCRDPADVHRSKSVSYQLGNLSIQFWFRGSGPKFDPDYAEIIIPWFVQIKHK